MSAPVHYCWISKAARGDEKAYQMLIGAFRYNLISPAYTILGCRCDPPCPEPTESQLNTLNDKIKKDLKEYEQRTSK